MDVEQQLRELIDRWRAYAASWRKMGDANPFATIDCGRQYGSAAAFEKAADELEAVLRVQ